MIGIIDGDAWIIASSDGNGIANEIQEWLEHSRGEPMNAAGCLLHWRSEG
jgi:hypothetical protein